MIYYIYFFFLYFFIIKYRENSKNNHDVLRNSGLDHGPNWNFKNDHHHVTTHKSRNQASFILSATFIWIPLHSIPLKSIIPSILLPSIMTWTIWNLSKKHVMNLSSKKISSSNPSHQKAYMLLSAKVKSVHDIYIHLQSMISIVFVSEL